MLQLAMALFVTALGLSCGRKSPHAGADGPTSPVTADHRFEIAVGEVTAKVRVAVRSHEQQRGLMHVKSMPADEGMLFVSDSPRQASFWMRNTFIPLDIGFFDPSGELLEVRTMFPHVEDPVQSKSNRVQFSLEMNRGWFAAHEVRPGAKLDLAALRVALEARGFDAEDYMPGPDAGRPDAVTAGAGSSP